MNKLKRGLYVLTEDQRLDFDTVLRKSEIILKSGIAALQYRKKNAPASQKRIEAARLMELCCTYNTPLIINDELNLAVELNANGVHLGEDDVSCEQARSLLGEEKIIGVSCYNDLQRAEQAIAESADYLAFGAMYPTNTKSTTRQASPALLTEAKQRFSVPLVAIGGITPENCVPLLAAGAELLAVVSSIYHADHPDKIIEAFNKKFTNQYELV